MIEKIEKNFFIRFIYTTCLVSLLIFVIILMCAGLMFDGVIGAKLYHIYVYFCLSYILIPILCILGITDIISKINRDKWISISRMTMVCGVILAFYSHLLPEIKFKLFN